MSGADMDVEMVRYCTSLLNWLLKLGNTVFTLLVPNHDQENPQEHLLINLRGRIS